MPMINPQMLMALRQKPQGALAQPLTSNETSLVGDRNLPTQGRTITPIQGVRGGFDVAYNGNSVGQLLRGGKNGMFKPNGGPIPSFLNQLPQGQAMRGPSTPLGPGAGMQPQRQYAPNPFQRQLMMAQAMRKPTSVAGPAPTGGLQYG